MFLDKKKDSAALKRIREAIGEFMMTEEFEKASVNVLGYALNIWELDVTRKSNGDISEPWVRNLNTEGSQNQPSNE